ncbi:hypothetical protein ES702_02846 [subsurface metagenome]
METKEKETLKNIPGEVCNQSIVEDFYNEEKDKNKEPKNQIEKIINYLNEKSHKNFRSNNIKTKKLIKSRLNEGYFFEDFKKVIDIKTTQWINNKEFKKFLRPETLFGGKFEGYLNEGKTETDKDFNIKRAENCYKKCKGDCLVSGTIRLHSYCDYCIKVKSQTLQLPFKKEKSDTLKSSLKEDIKEKAQSKEIEIPKYKLKNSKFPIDLIEFPIKNSTKLEINKDKEGKDTIELYLSGYYGEYHIESSRNIKLMDYRTLLATLYFADYHKNKTFEEKFINWLDLLEVEDTGFYRKAILEGLKYLKKIILYTPYIYDLENKQRDFSFNLTDKGEIDWKNLPSFSVWGIIDQYHHLTEKGKRKTKLKIMLGGFYERMIKDNYFTLINVKKLLPLKDIALTLYLCVKRQDPKYISNYTMDFELLKAHIGITDKHITNARKTFEKAWNDIKDRELLKGYRHRIFISKKNNREYIKFVKQRSLKA